MKQNSVNDLKRIIAKHFNAILEDEESTFEEVIGFLEVSKIIMIEKLLSDIEQLKGGKGKDGRTD